MSRPVNPIETGIGLMIIGLSFFISLGGIYWLWLSFKSGSVVMFVLGVLPPSLFVTAPVGAWSLLFGPPDWLGGAMSAAAWC